MGVSRTAYSGPRMRSSGTARRHLKGCPGAPSVSASALAQMGRCERLMLFEHQHGCRRTASQREDRLRGLAAHRRFERDGLEAMASVDHLRGRWLARVVVRLVAAVLRWCSRRGPTA